MYTKKPTLQYAILALLLLWALISQLTFTGSLIYTQAGADKSVQTPFLLANFGTKISEITPAYEHSALKIGDDILAFNGQPLDSEKQVEEEWFLLRPGDTLSITLAREQNGRRQTLTIPVQMQPHSSRTLSWTRVIMFSGVLPLSCLLVGFFIAFARPHDLLAWITMAMLASFGQLVQLGNPSFLWSPWRELLMVYHALLNNSWPLWMLLFAYYFPIPLPMLKQRRWLVWAPAIPTLLLC